MAISGKTSFYPASFLVMTVTSLLFLGAITGLGVILIHYWLIGVSDILNDVFLLYWIASLVVVTPLHLLAYWQVRRTDKSQVTTFSLRFAHGLLGLYLFVTVGSAITLGTWLLALWLNALFGTGDINAALYAASLSLLQAIAWLVYATNHFLRLRENRSGPRLYSIVVGAVTLAVLVLSMLFPVQAYRDVARDTVKENDLTQLSFAIADYVDTRETLPTKFGDLTGLDGDTERHLGDYQYTAKGETKFGIFAYELCATFARSKERGHDTGFGFASHGAGKQCFTRSTISFDKLNQELAQYVKGLSNGAAKLQQTIQNFLLGAKVAVDQEITGVEGFASGQVKQLEAHLEGLEGGTVELQQEMERLEGNLTGLEGDTGQLAGDMAAVEKFFHDLGCLFGGCK